jgi:dsDNA-binding SOS-regulon protein
MFVIIKCIVYREHKQTQFSKEEVGRYKTVVDVAFKFFLALCDHIQSSRVIEGEQEGLKRKIQKCGKGMATVFLHEGS